MRRPLWICYQTGNANQCRLAPAWLSMYLKMWTGRRGERECTWTEAKDLNENMRSMERIKMIFVILNITWEHIEKSKRLKPLVPDLTMSISVSGHFNVPAKTEKSKSLLSNRLKFSVKILVKAFLSLEISWSRYTSCDDRMGPVPAASKKR